MNILKTGSRLKSALCDTEVMVIRARPEGMDLRSGGAAMIPFDAERPQGLEIEPAFAQGTLIGKRYSDEQDSIELLCTKGGKGSLSVDGKPLIVKQAKALPSSD